MRQSYRELGFMPEKILRRSRIRRNDLRLRTVYFAFPRIRQFRRVGSQIFHNDFGVNMNDLLPQTMANHQGV